ncbi:MAG: EAL domain-containing protein [Mycobacteriales bacterium]
MLNDRDQLRRFEALVHSSPDFIAVAGMDGKVEFLNAAGRSLVGIGPEVDVTVTSVADYLTEAGTVASFEIEQPAVVRDGFWTGASTLRDWRDDSEIPVMITSFVLRDPGTNEPVAMATIQRDLRDLHAASAEAAEATSALRRGEDLQRALLLHMSDLVLLVDADSNLMFASSSAARVLGYEPGGQLGRSVLEMVHPDDRVEAAAFLQSVLQQPGDSPRVRVRALTATGEAVPFEARANNLLHEASVGGVVITARDVSEAVEAERSQNDLAQLLELIASEAPVQDVLAAIVTWVERELTDTRCTVLLTEAGVPHPVLRDGASPSMPDAYRVGIDGSSVGTPTSPCAVAVSESRPILVADLLADQRWAPMHALADHCQVRSCWSYPITSPASGETLGSFALYRSVPGLPHSSVETIVGRASHLVGITLDRLRLLHRLGHQAQHDALTLLPNRMHLLERLSQSLDNFAQGGAGPVVFFFDLDRLKVINDSLGHEVGDELLVGIADRIQAAAVGGDLVARFGGDEFVVLSTQNDAATEAAERAAALLAVIGEPMVLEGRLVQPAASMGVVVATSDQSSTEVMRDADIAMYRAKQRGGNGFELFGEHMRQRAFDRLDLEGQIRHGLDNDEFRVYYQPLVDLLDHDHIVGFEALVRWEHPQRGLLEPAAFLQLAEETGLIIPLGEWVLKTAASTVGHWRESVSEPDFTLSVNLAAQQLPSVGLLPLVTDSVQALGPWTLCLELTESTLMDDAVAGLHTLEQLTGLGAQIAIDDFGTGFSSLSYLSRLPVQRLKIDRSFVGDLGNSRAAAAVATTIISLAQQLDIISVAEGIETVDQRQQLIDMGCQYGQGYLLSRPVPEAEALLLLTSPSRR